MNRKRHNHEAGYIAERVNPFVPHTKVVIYNANEQGIDVAEYKYAVVCDAHGQIGGEDSVRLARQSMKQPDDFCVECRVLAEETTAMFGPAA